MLRGEMGERKRESGEGRAGRKERWNRRREQGEVKEHVGLVLPGQAWHGEQADTIRCSIPCVCQEKQDIARRL